MFSNVTNVLTSARVDNFNIKDLYFKTGYIGAGDAVSELLLIALIRVSHQESKQ